MAKDAVRDALKQAPDMASAGYGMDREAGVRLSGTRPKGEKSRRTVDKSRGWAYGTPHNSPR